MTQQVKKYDGPRQQGDSIDTKEAMAIITAARKRGKSLTFPLALAIVKRRREIAAAALRSVK